MDNLNIQNLQELYLSTASGTFFNITYLSISLGINTVPTCMVSLSTGGMLKIGESSIDTPTFPLLDEDCDIFYTVNDETYLLFSGFIAGEQSSIQSTTDIISSTRTFRIASHTEKIDAIPPMAVRYLSNAVTGSQQAQHNFVVVTDSATTGAKKALGKDKDYSNMGKLIIDSVTEIQGAISMGSANPLSEHLATDKIALKVNPPPVDLQHYIVNNITNLILSGHSYFSAIMSLCRNLHLSLVPRLTSKGTLMCITHCNPWCTPSAEQWLIPADYTTINITNMSRKSTNIDGIIIPNYGDSSSPATDLYTFYGQYKGSKGQIHTVSKNTLVELSNTTSLKFAERSLPGWLIGAASSRKDAIERLCKEYFAQEALTSQQMSIVLPTFSPSFANLQNIFEFVGKPVEIWCPVKENIDLDAITGAHDKYYAFCQGLTLQLSLLPKYVNTSISMQFSHVRGGALQDSLKLSDSELLYSVS